MESVTIDRYQSDEERWQTVMDRRRSAEGLFYYAVRTTGVYCRPTCSSRRPNRTNVCFFETGAEAERAGFRPCARCRPDAVSAQQRAVAVAKHLLETEEPAPSLADLGEAVGFSPWHLQRLFKRVTGLTPRQYAASCRAQDFRERLKPCRSVTAAMFEAGYGSVRGLYEEAPVELGMTPGAYRRSGRGQQIDYAVVNSPLGRLLIAVTAKGVCALRFGEDAALVEELRAEFPAAVLREDEGAVAPYAQAAREFLHGRQSSLPLPLDIGGTRFQQRVWAVLGQIPYGQTRSYSEIARAIGAPNAVRAVARACASNPVAIIILCHRVISARGAVSGYRWGPERKRRLLELEHS